jgi:hypothetical protein
MRAETVGKALEERKLEEQFAAVGSCRGVGVFDYGLLRVREAVPSLRMAKLSEFYSFYLRA